MAFPSASHWLFTRRVASQQAGDKKYLSIVKKIMSGSESGIIHYSDKNQVLLGLTSETDVGGEKINILVLEARSYKTGISDNVHLVIGIIALVLFFSIIFFGGGLPCGVQRGGC